MVELLLFLVEKEPKKPYTHNTVLLRKPYTNKEATRATRKRKDDKRRRERNTNTQSTAVAMERDLVLSRARA